MMTLDDAELSGSRANCRTMVENAVASVPWRRYRHTSIMVWDPAWTPDRMTDEARLVLNMW